jgi:mitochondrial import receptor subunit TOM40
MMFQPGMGRAGLFSSMRKEGNATVGVKYQFLTSSFRAQVDSQGKLGVLVEKTVLPTVQLVFAGELDQATVC